MRGSDGKFYKADLKGINLKQGQEVYDLSIIFIIFSSQLG